MMNARKRYASLLSMIVLAWTLHAQTVTKFITVDQFGYFPNAKKVAVVIDPQTGSNAAESFSPSTGANQYQVRRVSDNMAVFTGTLSAWKAGQTHTQSGDRGWYFDFSSVTTPGNYYIFDVSLNVKSFAFDIGSNVYDEVLRQAMRTFYYQRLGIAKTAPYAAANWTDVICFDGATQDKAARLYTAQTNATTAKDLRGGWMDAGDVNKYTTFAEKPVIQLIEAYRANPNVFKDNYNIPESGNGVPDVLDEIKYEMEFFKRMQDATGTNGFLLKMGNIDYNTPQPPLSNDTRSRYYVGECTSATLSGAAMFAAVGAGFKSQPALLTYANDLITRAENAWIRAKTTTSNFTVFQQACDDGTVKAGDADKDIAGQKASAFMAAVYLFEATGKAEYKTYVDANYTTMSRYTWFGPYDTHQETAMLRYSVLANSSAAVATNIRSQKANMDYQNSINNYNTGDDLYRAHMADPEHNWGSNQMRSDCGNINLDFISYNINPAKHAQYREVAEQYLHYLHGVNPFSLVMLSNMDAYGSENSVNQIYHSWFYDGSVYDHAKTSAKGPAPGFLTGGANKFYSGSLFTPSTEAVQKCYREVNTTNNIEKSWELTEPAIYYQAAYISMLSRLMTASADTTKPTIATNLAANNITANSMTLAWTASTDNVGVTGYNLYRDTILVQANIATTTFNLTNLTCGTQYKYTVKAKDAAGNLSLPSNLLTVNTLACDTTKPSVPTNLFATQVTATSMILNWNPATDNVGVTAYEVYRNGALLNGNVTGMTWLDITGLTCGTAYTFTVKAKDAAGNVSAMSNVLNTNTLACADIQAPSVPTNLFATQVTATSMILNWNPATDNVGVTAYEVYRNGTLLNGNVAGMTWLDITGLTCGTAYTFTVKAKDAAGNVSAMSNVLNTNTLACADTQAPSVPTNLFATQVTATSMILNWNPATDNVGVTAYEVYRNGTLLNGNVTGMTWLDVTGLTCGTAYTFTVKAKDAAGNVSAMSNILNTNTLACADTQTPSVPTNLFATQVTATSMILNWNPATDNVGVTAYEVYRNGTLLNGNVTGMTWLDVTGLTCGTAYTFAVKAKDAAGNVSIMSDSLIMNTLACATVPPAAPTNLSASEIIDNELILTWISNDTTAVSYDIYKNGIFYENIVDKKALLVTDLTCATPYSFYVKAKNIAGIASVASNEILTMTLACIDTIAPTIPQNLAVSIMRGNTLVINWASSTDNIGVTAYEVYQDGIVIDTNVTSTNFSVLNLNCLSNYKFNVIAKDAAGNISAFSDTLAVTTLDCPDIEAPSKPTSLAATNVTQTGLILDWTASSDNVGVAAYEVFQNGVFIATDVVGTTFNVTGLTCATAYTFNLRAKDGAGNASAISDTLQIMTTNCPDTQAPTVPNNLAATNISATGLTLNWTASTDNIGVTAYEVYRGATLLNALVTGTTYNVTGLTCGTAYTFTVKAKDVAGNISAASNTLNSNTTNCPDTQAPTVPIGLTATSKTATSINLAWTASTDNIGVTAYEIYLGTTLVSSSVATTSLNITGLTCNTSYTFTVKAKDATGNISAASAAFTTSTNVCNTDTQAPTVPNTLKATNVVATSLTLGWKASTDNVGVTAYEVYRGITLVNGNVTTNSLKITGLTCNTTYSFTVRAKDTAGNKSAASTALSQKTSTCAADTQAPTVPTSLTATNKTATGLTLNWAAATDNVGVTAYEVYRGTTLVNANVTTRSLAITGLTCNTSYTFTVKAKDAAGNKSVASSGLTTSTNACPDTQAPTVPTNLTTTSITATGLTLSWTASTDNIRVTAYEIYRGTTLISSSVTTTSITITGLSCNTSYTFTVKAKDAAGNVSAASTGLVRTTLACPTDTQAPTVPANLTVGNITTTGMTLTWAASTDNVGVTAYEVFRGITLIASNVTSTSYTFTGLTCGTVYSLSVKAKDAAGNKSVASSTLSASTAPCVTGVAHMIYSDTLATDWSDWGYGSTSNFAATTTIKSGTKSIEVNFTDPFGGISMRKETAIPTSNVIDIRFWAYAAFAKNLNIYVQTDDTGGQSTIVPVSLPAGVWTEFVVTPAQLGNPAAIKRVTVQANNATGIVYFDDIRIMTNTMQSKVTKADLNIENANIFPNPTSGAASFRFEHNNLATKGQLSIIQATTGRVVYQEDVMLQRGENILSIDCADYPSGQYIVVLNDQITLYRGKILVQND